MVPTWKHACLLAASASVPTFVHAAEYKLLREYSGPSFFDGWNFFGQADILNNGHVEFINASAAGNPDTSLAYVDPETNRAIIKVDDTNRVVWDNKRGSVRITTKEAYDFGSVFVADIYHFPYGCSVWSSLWSWNEASGASWPDGGEIDIFEAINQAPRSQMGLHTLPGCVQPAGVNQLSTEVRTTNCAGDLNSGCIVANTDSASYGPPLNEGSGGVYVTEYAETGISIWFFPRSRIPGSITPDAKFIDTATLGEPMGYWPAGNECDLKRLFKPQNIVMKITLCGDFAGPLFNQTGCSGDCYLDWVLGEPSRYSEAYFDVASLRIFSSESAAPPTVSGKPVSSGSSGTPTGGPSNSTETEEPGTAIAVKASTLLLSSFAIVASLAFISL